MNAYPPSFGGSPNAYGAWPPASASTWTPPSSSSPQRAVEPKRNVALLVVGGVLLVLSLGVGLLFATNLYQYLTIEDRWAADPLLSADARDFGVAIIQRAAMKRMMVFGPVSGLLGIGGLVLGLLGLRKR